MRMRVVAAGLVVALAAGCGGGTKVVAEGKVVMGGKAYNPDVDGDVTVSLSSDGGGATHTAKVQPDGTFAVKDDKGVGIPAGKYKVGYTQYPSKAEMAKLKGPPTPKTKTTSDVWDVAPGSSYTLDLDKAK